MKSVLLLLILRNRRCFLVEMLRLYFRLALVVITTECNKTHLLYAFYATFKLWTLFSTDDGMDTADNLIGAVGRRFCCQLFVSRQVVVLANSIRIDSGLPYEFYHYLSDIQSNYAIFD